MKQPTLCVSMILGGNTFKEDGDGAVTLAQCLESLIAIKADQFVVVDTGINDDARAAIDSHNAVRKEGGLPFIEVYPFEWIDHFAAARNEGLAHVTTDFMMWIDGDDTLRGSEFIRPALVGLREHPEMLGAWCPYEYGYDGDGNVTTLHSRERIIRMDAGFEWQNRIHEVLVPDRPGIWLKEPRIVWQHLRGYEAQTERNLRLLYLQYHEEPNDIRTWLYLGHQYFMGGEWEKAVEWYERFFQDIRGFFVERWQSMCYCSRAYRMMERFEEARQVAKLAVEYVPWFSDGYLQLAEAHIKLGEIERAIHWAEFGRTQQEPPDPAFTNPVEEAAEYSCILNPAYAMLGDYDNAILETDIALGYMPNNEALKENRRLWVDAKQKQKARDGFVSMTEGLSDTKVLAMSRNLNGLGKENEIRDITIPILMRKAARGTQPKITIMCGQTLDNWSSATPDEQGIGGSETAVVEITRRLQKDGFQVSVFNSCGIDEGKQDGVLYVDHRRWRPDLKTDTHVSWRSPHPDIARIEAETKWLWMHDLNKRDDLTEENTHEYQRIFGVSQFHADYLARVYPFMAGRTSALPNGVNLDRFDLEVEREPFKVIYTSSPDRGLIHLLDMWPQILATEPEAELHIFYGWDNIDRLIEMGDQSMVAYKELCLLKGKQHGINWRGRVSQGELAREFLSAQVWAYPTSFVETFCVGAVEAMAADCYITTSGVGNLPYVVGDAGWVIPGHAGSTTYRKRFMGLVLAGLIDVEVRNKFKGMGPEQAKQWTWDEAYKVWAEALTEKVLV
jgi:glycosyltransferase involved in cell wall biosynthesis